MLVPVGRDHLNILVGAFVLAFFVGLGVLGYRGNFSGDMGATYPLYARFGTAEGVAPGSPVLFLGIEAGRVASLMLDPARGGVILTLDIDPDIAFPRDSAAKILSTGIDGGKYVKISPGGEYEMLAPGARFEFTQDAVNFVELLQRVIEGAETVRQSPSVSRGQDS